MRICSPHVSVSPESNSGGEVYERELLTYLARRGVEIDLILPGKAPYPQNLPNWVVHRTRLPRGFRWYISNFVFPSYIKQVYNERPFDILRIHSLRFVGLACLWAKYRYRLGVPVVAHHHHIDPEFLSYFVDRQVVRQVDFVVTDSQFSSKQLEVDFGISKSKIAVIYAGIDVRFKPQQRDSNLEQRWGLKGKQVILFVGGLKPRKNIPFLLEIFARLVAASDINGNLCLLIVGDGTMRAELQRKVERLGLTEQVIFTGFVPEADKVAYYNLADILAFPSILEGFGLVVVEAMSCAIPVVVSDAGSLPELVINEETGYIVPSGDIDLFVSRIKKLLDNQELRLKMGQAGRTRVDKMFRWDITAQKMEALYQSLIETGKGAGL